MNPSKTCATIRRLTAAIAYHHEESRCWVGEKAITELEMADALALRLYQLRRECDRLGWKKCAALATRGLAGTSFHNRGEDY